MAAAARKRVGVLVAAIGLAALLGGSVAAQPKAKKAPSAPALDVTGIGEKLRSSDPGKLAEALDAAEKGGPTAAAAGPAIQELLRRGTTNDLAKAAIDALGAIGQPSSSAVLRPYARHRSQDLRRAAIKALVNTKGPEALAAFKEGLRSSDAVVRGFSATGLGELGAHDALPELFEALDHRVAEAAPAIGRLCEADECDKLAARLGRFGSEVMTSGFDALLFRARPLPDDTLVRIVGRLRELGTRESGKYLADVQGRWPKTGSARVKQAIDSAVTARPNGKGS
jgi:HEAT repeat protein